MLVLVRQAIDHYSSVTFGTEKKQTSLSMLELVRQAIDHYSSSVTFGWREKKKRRWPSINMHVGVSGYTLLIGRALRAMLAPCSWGRAGSYLKVGVCGDVPVMGEAVVGSRQRYAAQRDVIPAPRHRRTQASIAGERRVKGRWG